MTEIPKIIGTIKYINKRRTIIDIIFIQIPTRIISEIFNSPEPNTIALGGVATGNMKAQDAAIAVAHISKMGFISIASARAAIIGSIIDVVTCKSNLTSCRRSIDGFCCSYGATKCYRL